MRRALDQRPRHIVDRIDGVGSDRMQRGPVAVGPNRQNAGRGLHAGLANNAAGIDAVAVERADEYIAEGVLTDGAGSRNRQPQFREADRSARGGSRRREPNLVEQDTALSLGNVRDVAAKDVEDMRAERHRLDFSLNHSARACVVCARIPVRRVASSALRSRRIASAYSAAAWIGLAVSFFLYAYIRLRLAFTMNPVPSARAEATAPAAVPPCVSYPGTRIVAAGISSRARRACTG